SSLRGLTERPRSPSATGQARRPGPGVSLLGDTPSPFSSARSDRRLLQRPHAVGVSRRLERLDRRGAGHTIDREPGAARVELGLSLLPHVEVLAGVVVEALGADRREAREDLVARIAVPAPIGVV